MLLLTSQQSKALDLLLCEQHGFTMDSLIQRAAERLTKLFFKVVNLNKYKKIYFLIGPGNNGADGLFMAKNIAKHLSEKGVHKLSIEVFALNSNSHKDSWTYSSIKYKEYQEFLSNKESSKVLIIDALFGVGLHSFLKPPYDLIIQKVNQQKNKTVISIDISSGLNSDTGNIEGVAIRADYTFSCVLPKVGCFLNHGPYLSGKIFYDSLGLPNSAVKFVAKDIRLIRQQEAKKIFPYKSYMGNKSKSGHLLVIAGSEKMSGAMRLCSEAAYRMGVGYVTLVLPDILLNLNISPDFILLSQADFLKMADDELKKKYSAILMGPGLSGSFIEFQIFKKLLSLNIKSVMDAGVFQFISQLEMENKGVVKSFLHENCLLTPHAGELSRLIQMDSAEIENFRFKAIDSFRKKFNCPLLLKGPKTIVSFQDKKYIIYSGNKALAKAGTGDVLAGMIASLMAQGLDLAKAASLGAFIHGSLADQWLGSGKSVQSMMASDLVNELKFFSMT